MIRQTLLVTGMAALLSACGGGSESNGMSGSDNYSMSTSEPGAGAALPVGADAPNPYVESIATSSEELVVVPESESSGISTGSDFLFETARTVGFRVNLADIAGSPGVLSVCTDFEETASGFNVNYSSCPIRGTVENGQFEHDLSLVNQFDSVVAVIWFRDEQLAPMYRKFVTTDSAGTQEWVWN